MGATDNAEAIGTVQDAANAGELSHFSYYIYKLYSLTEIHNGSRVVAGSIAKAGFHLPEKDILRYGLFTYYNTEKSQVHYGGDPTHGTEMLSPFVDFYEFALLDGKRITPTSRSRRNTAGSSIIQARYNNEAYAGEVRHLIQHRQPGISADNSTMLAHVLWMKRSNLTPLDAGKFPWDN